MAQIRRAKPSEIDWVNECYDQVKFVHSTFDNEIIAIAESCGQKAGLGRLVTIDANNLELGGMYVFDSFRNQGIARKLVEFLLKSSPLCQNIYCIPFEHLVSFYGEFGFVKCSNLEQVPEEIAKKYSWCQDEYSNPTALLVLKKETSIDEKPN